MDRTQKAAAIDRVAEQITESEAVFVIDYRGVSVPQAAELRSRLRESDATFRVVKNSLTERAVDKVGTAELKAYLDGPTAMTFVRGDAALAAKTLSEFRRQEEVLTFKGGWMNGAILSVPEIEAIAKLPAREVLYGRLTGMVASPLTGLVTGLGGLIGGLARQLQQISDQGLVGGSTSKDEVEPTMQATTEAKPETESAGEPSKEKDEPEAQAAEESTPEQTDQPKTSGESDSEPAAESENKEK